MSKETITHEIKLQPALLVILGVMAFGILVIALPSTSPIPEVRAEVAGMDYWDLKSDYDFKKAVKRIVNNCSVEGGYVDGGYIYGSNISC
jgi:hypothetical protein